MRRLNTLGGIGVIVVVAAIVALAGITHRGPFAGAVPVATGPVSGSQVAGPFELILTASKGLYRADEAVEVKATLTYHGPDAEVRIGHGLNAHDGPVGFGIVEPVGPFRLSPFTRTACTSSTLVKDQPLAVAFEKSGVSFGDNGPTPEEMNAFFTDPILRVPAGTWHVYAIAEFSPGDCSANPMRLRAEVTLYVPASDGSIPTAPPPTPTTDPLDLPVGDDTQEGPIQVTLGSPHRRWRVNQPIDVAAGVAGGDPATTIKAYGSSRLGPIAFSVRQLDGPIVITPQRSDECSELFTLPLYERTEFAFRKSGTAAGVPARDAFWASWFEDPVLRLPAGNWEITATPAFSTSSDCTTPGPNLRPTITITVTP